MCESIYMQFIDDEAGSTSSSSRRSRTSLVRTRNSSGRRQARYWAYTIPANSPSVPGLYGIFDYTKGQKEEGERTGYIHWQVYGYSKKKVSRQQIYRAFGFSSFDLEPTDSKAYIEYVWKEDTRIEGSQFEIGEKPFDGSIKANWELVRNAAKAGNLESEDIPPHVFVHSYSALRRIASDYMAPTCMQRTTTVIWGSTGLGKSRYAWAEAGWGAYPKDPNSKFWCGYQNQLNVIIDEFRGGIDIGHILRWLDRYPVIVEVKGSAKTLVAQKIWITSNLHPRDWYPAIDRSTYEALLRRLGVTDFVSEESPNIIHADSFVFDWDLPVTPNIENLE